MRTRELLHDRWAERREIGRRPTRGQRAVDDDLLVDNLGPGVTQIRTDAGPRRHPAPPNGAGLEQHPGGMAYCGDWLAVVGKSGDEGDRVFVHSQLIGVDRAARQQEGIVFVDSCVGDELVDLERRGGLEVHLARLDFAVVYRQQLGLGAGAVQRASRLFQFDTLDAVCGQGCDPLALQLVGHDYSQGGRCVRVSAATGAISAARLQDDLRPAFVAAVEVLVRVRSFVQAETMGHDERRLCLAGVDQVSQVAVVALHGALAGAHFLALEPEHPEVEVHVPLLGQLVRGAGVPRDEDADDADAAGEANRVDQVVQGLVRMFVPLWIVRLVAHALAPAVRAKAVGLVEHTLNRGFLGVVDRECADRLRQPQPVGVAVDDHDLARASDRRGVRGHQADRTAAVDHHRFTWLYAGELGSVPASGKDIGEHHVVVLLFLRVLWEAQRVEVGPRHSQVLGLTALPRAHVGEPIGRAGHVLCRLSNEAIVREPPLAVDAVSARDVEWQAHPVTDLDLLHRLADLDNPPEVLVPKRASLFEVGPPFIHVQVRATDVGARDLHQGVRGLLDPWVWNVADANVPWTVIDNSFHHATSVESGLPARDRALR